jgi:hypothetical protein
MLMICSKKFMHGLSRSLVFLFYKSQGSRAFYLGTATEYFTLGAYKQPQVELTHNGWSGTFLV